MVVLKKEKLKKNLIFRILFKIFKFFDMPSHFGLNKIAWLGLAKKQNFLLIVQHMLKNISKNYGPVFPYF
jgi:hypothetical protein